ncbi:SRPBCC family protein [Embleya sp. NPDC056575]|uniref:SRPBCC family protein n=1 Tax=unclassified Embleya TaxID=2699296 RepID=UPI0036AC69C5
MAVLNVHERRIQAPCEQVGALIDRLASADDPLWPGRSWPRMVLDRGLCVGSRGGHGPIRYSVEAYVPGQWVRFRFSAPRGFDGTHEFVVQPAEPGGTVIRHVIAMRLHGSARLSWPLVFRRLHDALVEDCLDRAESAFEPAGGGRAERSTYVRLLRYLGARNARRSPGASAPTGLRTG